MVSASDCLSSAALNNFIFVRFLSSSVCTNSPLYQPTDTFTSNEHVGELALPGLEARCHLQRLNLKKKERKRKCTSDDHKTKQNQAKMHTWMIGAHTPDSGVCDCFRSVSGSWLLRLVQCVKILELRPHDGYTFPNVFMHNKKFK